MLLQVCAIIDDSKLRQRIRRMLRTLDAVVEFGRAQAGLWEQIKRGNMDILIVSRNLLPARPAETLAQIRQIPDPPRVIAISDHEDPDERANLLASGCDAVLYAGLPNEKLRDVLAAFLEKRRGQEAKLLVADAGPVRNRLSDFISISSSMQNFISLAQRVAMSDAGLLLLGETGVGKEHLARAIHGESSRSGGAFITVNCGALPETLLESELFGHEEGAFTGAHRPRRGWFELAHHGTIFLDEIGEIPTHLQVKLLRVLQEHTVQRLGSEKALNIDVRVIAATNRDLAAEVAAGKFRKDLFYRLSVVTLTLPALRSRREDIPALVMNYIQYFQTRLRTLAEDIAPEALDALMRYAWPGNVRELINVIERAMILCNGSLIELKDLPEAFNGQERRSIAHVHEEAERSPHLALPEDWMERPLSEVRIEALEQLERRYLAELLRNSKGHLGKTAQRAGITPRALYNKMRRYDLSRADFRAMHPDERSA
ncbi:sigma-54-dependent Fis family transcriptional regulator [Candidatus Sumerlaeota bacterium]|nr:sigma-54-dependent Fis family transcriptional regulator [Candidatus Sumerlaeota bacterium]